MIRLALASALVALAACQTVTDLTAGADARCAEAQRFYDADRNVTAGVGTFVACIR
jgi:hypothetical protein